MEFLIVSKAPIVADIPRISPQQRPPRKTSPKRHKPRPRLSLSLDTLPTDSRPVAPPADPTNQIKPKKRRKARKSHSTSRCAQISAPLQVSKEIHPVVSSPHRSAPALNKHNRQLSPYKMCPKAISQPLTLSPDRIIKRAISNLMSRSVSYSNPAAYFPAKGMLTPNKPPRPNPYINNSYTPLVPYRTKQVHMNVPLKRKRVYLSETHNPGVMGSTAGRIPPLNSPLEVSHSIELVPSLGDAKSQVCLQKELRALESRRHAVAAANCERERAQNERRLCEDKLRAKSQFRAEIYALNRVMREFEEIKFNESLSAKV